MKKLLLSILAIGLGAVASHATTYVVYDSENRGEWTESGDGYTASFTVDGANFQITTEKGTYNNPLVSPTKYDEFRVYKGSSLRIDSETVKMTQVILTVSASKYAINMTADAEWSTKVDTSALTITLSGAATQQLTITAPEAQVRITKIEVSDTPSTENPDEPENPENPDDPQNPDDPENPDEPQNPETPESQVKDLLVFGPNLGSVWNENEATQGFVYEANVSGYDFTITTDKGTSSTALLCPNDDDWRVYKNSSFTISSPNLSMKSIEIEVTAKKYAVEMTVSDGWTYNLDGTTYTITSTGLNEIAISASAAQIRIKSVKISGDPSGNPDLKNPEIAFTVSQLYGGVGLACQHPTLENPNKLAVTYSSSNEDVAKVDAEGNLTLVGAGTSVITATSAETTEYRAGKATYNITVGTPVETLADIVENGKAGEKYYMKEDVDIVYAHGSYNYIKDNATSSLIFAPGLGYKAGDVVPGGWVCSVSIFNGLFEIVDPIGMGEAYDNKEVVYPTLATWTLGDVNKVGWISGVEFTAATAAADDTRTNFNGTVGEETVVFRNTFGTESVEAGTYDVLVGVSCYKEAVQLLPIEYKVAESVGVAEIAADGVAEYYNLQGVRVANPENGIFIKVANGKASKVICNK